MEVRNGPSCRNAEIIPLGNNTLYIVGTSVGLFGTSSLDNINTEWEQISEHQIGSVVCEYLTFRPNDGQLVVATHGNGIYQTNITSLSDVLSLDQAFSNNDDVKIYPNPSSNKIYLDLFLNNTKSINISIFDDLGRLVSSVDKTARFGQNKIGIDIQKLKPGTYFIGIKNDNKTTFKQIIKK